MTTLPRPSIHLGEAIAKVVLGLEYCDDEDDVLVLLKEFERALDANLGRELVPISAGERRLLGKLLDTMNRRIKQHFPEVSFAH